MNVLFYIPAVLFLISGFPQMFKLLKTKKSDDISVWMYFVTLLAVAIIMADALVHRNYSIFVSNATSFVISAINTFLILKYRTK